MNSDQRFRLLVVTANSLTHCNELYLCKAQTLEYCESVLCSPGKPTRIVDKNYSKWGATDNARSRIRLVVLDGNGISRFNELLNGKRQPTFYAFDLLWPNGEDLRQLPLIEKRLQKLVRSAPGILHAQHIERDGKNFFREICERD